MTTFSPEMTHNVCADIRFEYIHNRYRSTSVFPAMIALRNARGCFLVRLDILVLDRMLDGTLVR